MYTAFRVSEAWKRLTCTSRSLCYSLSFPISEPEKPPVVNKRDSREIVAEKDVVPVIPPIIVVPDPGGFVLYKYTILYSRIAIKRHIVYTSCVFE